MPRTGDRLRTPEAFELVRANQAEFDVTKMCRVLGVSPSGYYAWKDRPPSARAVENERLLKRMREIHTFSRETYGRPRMYAELRDDGWLVNRKRVARLMSLDGLQGATRRRKWRTTKRAKDARPAPDLVGRNSVSMAPISFGSLTSPTYRLGADSCIWPSSWTHGVAVSWGGQWRHTSGQTSSFRR